MLERSTHSATSRHLNSSASSSPVLRAYPSSRSPTARVISMFTIDRSRLRHRCITARRGRKLQRSHDSRSLPWTRLMKFSAFEPMIYISLSYAAECSMPYVLPTIYCNNVTRHLLPSKSPKHGTWRRSNFLQRLKLFSQMLCCRLVTFRALKLNNMLFSGVVFLGEMDPCMLV